jgi:carbamoyl-phosphate synthase large subunit
MKDGTQLRSGNKGNQFKTQENFHSPKRTLKSFLMNVLLTSVGRRNYLIDYFKEAVHPYGGKVFAINNHDNAPALYVADAYEVAPAIYSEGYVDFLIDFCERNKIKAIIPLLDNDLPVLAQSKSKFESKGIYVLVADLWVTKMANDKLETFEFLKKKGFQTVPTFCDLAEFYAAKSLGKIDFPVIIKPRWGMASLSVYLAENEEELNFYYKKAKKEVANSFLKYESGQDPEHAILIMEKITGEEFMLDIINDLSGEYQLTVVNKKLLRKGGETEAVETVHHPELEALGKELSDLIRHPLVMDSDVFWRDGKAFILEFNPRFSGGYPFTHFSGVNLPKALMKWLHGEVVDKSDYLTPRFGTKGLKGITIIGAA